MAKYFRQALRRSPLFLPVSGETVSKQMTGKVLIFWIGILDSCALSCSGYNVIDLPVDTPIDTAGTLHFTPFTLTYEKCIEKALDLRPGLREAEKRIEIASLSMIPKQKVVKKE